MNMVWMLHILQILLDMFSNIMTVTLLIFLQEAEQQSTTNSRCLCVFSAIVIGVPVSTSSNNHK